MNYEAQGIITEKLALRVVSDKFSSQEFAIKINDAEYPQEVKFQVTNKNIEKLDKAKVGDEVLLKFNLRGKRYEKEGKTSFFNSLDVWYIEVKNSHGVASSQPTEDVQDFEVTSDSDLPF
jgi:hypothetical protein